VKAVGVGCDRLPSGEHESGSGSAFEVVLEGGKHRQLMPANEALSDLEVLDSSEGGAGRALIAQRLREWKSAANAF
jgi:hypothetical protein